VRAVAQRVGDLFSPTGDRGAGVAHLMLHFFRAGFASRLKKESAAAL
jgi:hypothetical protein